MEERILKIRKRIDRLSESANQDKSDLKYLFKELKKDFKLKDIKSAKEKIKSVQKELRKLKTDLSDYVDELEEELEEYE